MNRRDILALGAVALARPAIAQGAFPQRPVRIVLPFPPGGPTDVVARILGERMARDLGQPVVIENRPGANGNIAGDAVAKAEPDGYTTLYNTSSIAVSRALYRNLPYDVLRDLVPVALAAAAPLVLVVHPGQPPRDPAGFIAWAKASGGRIAYSSGGNGNISHLLSFLVMRHIGAEAVHVPYRGTAPALTDTAAGNVQFTCDTLLTVLPLVQDGRVRAIAVSSAERSPLLPEVPSMAEAGMMPPDFEVGAWQGLLAPARTPGPVVARLNAALNVAVGDAEIRAKLGAQGVRTLGGTPEEYAHYMKQEVERWQKVVTESGATAD